MKATRICSFPECGRRLSGRGYCGSHLAQLRRGGELRPIKPRRIGCAVKGCNDKHKGNGYCEKHLVRYRRHGDATAGVITDPAERFAAYTDQTETCWLWTGALNTYGYASIRRGDGLRMPAHRYSYERFVGPIAEGLHIDHLCRVRHCVNPEHLQPVTPAENDYRGRVAATMTDSEYARWVEQRQHEWSHKVD